MVGNCPAHSSLLLMLELQGRGDCLIILRSDGGLVLDVPGRWLPSWPMAAPEPPGLSRTICEAQLRAAFPPSLSLAHPVAAAEPPGLAADVGTSPLGEPPIDLCRPAASLLGPATTDRSFLQRAKSPAQPSGTLGSRRGFSKRWAGHDSDLHLGPQWSRPILWGLRSPGSNAPDAGLAPARGGFGSGLLQFTG